MNRHNILESRREALEERREAFEDRRGGRGERQFGRHEDREERRFDRHEDHEERLHERREEHHRPHLHDQDQPHYAPPSGAPPGAPSGGYSRADFVSDDEFQRMMHNGEFEKPRRGAEIGPEDHGEWDQSGRPPPNAGYQPSYQQQPNQAHQRYPEPPLPSIPNEQRPSGYGYESSAYSQPSHNSYSVPGALELGHGGGAYAPPAGAPGYSSHAPAGGFSAPPQVRPSYVNDVSQTQEGSGRGAASDYYNGPPPGQQGHPYSHVPDIAAAHSDSANPALHQQYHEAAQGLHENYQAQQPHPSGEFDEEKYSSHFAAHAQAYGANPDGRPMGNDDIGTAAAVEAMKITAANNQQSNARPQQGGNRPQGGFQAATNVPQERPSSAQQSGRPSSGKPPRRPQNADESGSGSGSGSEDEGPAAKPQAPAGGGSPQDKIVALAMAQAGKLFDKKGGGDNQGKAQAMQTAAATAMRMMGEYKTTGKVNMQPGEMQKLMGLAMSLF